jgi:hypothetical protein
MRRKPFVTAFWDKGVQARPSAYLGFSPEIFMTEPSIEPESREESAGERKDETMRLCPFKSGYAMQRFAAGFCQGQNSANDENNLGSKAAVDAGIRRKAFLFSFAECRSFQSRCKKARSKAKQFIKMRWNP